MLVYWFTQRLVERWPLSLALKKIWVGALTNMNHFHMNYCLVPADLPHLLSAAFLHSLITLSPGAIFQLYSLNLLFSFWIVALTHASPQLLCYYVSYDSIQGLWPLLCIEGNLVYFNNKNHCAHKLDTVKVLIVIIKVQCLQYVQLYKICIFMKRPSPPF